MNEMNKKYVHCVIMGDEVVGKTSISNSYIHNAFTDHCDVTVFDNYVVPVSVAGEEFNISMFDISAKVRSDRTRC